MAINKRKVLDAARRQVQKGARAKAFKEYGKLLAADPQDAKLLLEVGDTYRRWGETEEAITHYTKVASLHRSEGYDARAIAVLKQIINLDPMRHTVRVALAELYQQIGLASEAVAALQQVADVYAKEGRQRESLDLLRKMAAVDPANVQGRIKVAELLDKAGHATEAVEEYREAAAEFSRRDDTRAVVEMHERVLALSPKHLSTLMAAARGLCTLGEPARAEPYVLRAIEVEVKAEHYELACEVYAQLGNEERLTEMTRDLASLYRERGEDDRARDVTQRAPMGADLDGGDLGEGIDMDATMDESVVTIEEPVQEETSAAEHTESVFEQVDVHLGYGQYDEAIACLEGLLAESPQNFLALEKLGEAHSGKGEVATASEAWERGASIAREEGNAQAAADFERRIEELSADVAAGPVEFGEGFEVEIDDSAGDEISSLEMAEPGSVEGFDPAEESNEFSPGMELPEVGESIEVDIEGTFAASADAISEPDPSERILAEENDSGRIDEDLEEAEFYRQQSMTSEAAAIYRRVLETEPGHEVAQAKLAEIEQSAPVEAVADTPAEEEQADLEFDLDADSEADLETDFDSDLDLDFDVEPVIRDSNVAREEPEALATDAAEDFEIEIEIDGSPVDGQTPQPSAEEAIDFGEVAPAPGTDASTVEEGVAELFADFKQGVSEALDDSDYQTRFDLGIAYREMALLDDAIAEFRYCLDSPQWRLQSLQMIGLSSLDLGRPEDAVSHFEQALSAPDLSDAQKSGLYFDFGRAQAALGENDAAHNSFDRVRAIDPNFAGLDEFVSSLPPRTPGTEPEQYESFDDLMAEFSEDASAH